MNRRARLDARAMASGMAAGGALLVVVSTALGGSFEPGALPFALWGLLPWALLYVCGRFVRDRWMVAGAGVALLVGELGVRAAVFIFPRGSTAALLLLFSPVYLVGVALLPGALAGWIVGRAWRRSRGLGVPASALFAVLLAVLGVSLARPDLAPWAVAQRRATLALVGEPRVVTAERDLERAQVSDASAWFQTAELDGEPGDEIAVVNHHGGVLLDPVRFEIVQRIEHGRPTARGNDSFWNGFSRLARLDGRLVVVQSGGGYSETEVLELDGRLLWRYRPDPKLPPTALQAADLDGDGRLELYAAEGGRIVRLNGAGEEVWIREAGYGSSLVLAPATGDRPAWVVGTRGVRDGWNYLVWRDDGTLLAELPAASGMADFGATSVVDLDDAGGGRLLVTGRSLVRGVDLEGVRRFELDLGDLTFQQASAVRFEAGGSACLAVVGASSSDVARWRVLVLDSGRRAIYDEILGEPVGLMVAHRADGVDSLLLAVSGEGLWVLRPERP